MSGTNRWQSIYSTSIRDQPIEDTQNTHYHQSQQQQQHPFIHQSPTSPLILHSSNSTSINLDHSDIPVHPDLLRRRSKSPNHGEPPVLLPPESRHSIDSRSTLPDSAQSINSPGMKRGSCLQDDRSRKQQKTTSESFPQTGSSNQMSPEPITAFPTAASALAKSDTPLKPKSTRGSRACTVCRRLKMRCVDAENGPPCKRCRLGNHQCVFEESQRGKKGTKRTDLLAKNLQTVEQKLDAVMSKIQTQAGTSFASPPSGSTGIPFDLSQAHQICPKTTNRVVGSGNDHQFPSTSQLHSDRETSLRNDITNHQLFTQGIPHLGISLGNPSATRTRGSADGSSGATSSSSTPLVPNSSGLNQFSSEGRQPHPRMSHVLPTTHTNENVDLTRFAALPDFSRPSSPRLHSLPDNTLNPLGLLAEASLRNRHDRHRSDRSSSGSHRRTSSVRSMPPDQRTLSALDEQDGLRHHIAEESEPLGQDDDNSSQCSSTSSLQEPTSAVVDECHTSHHHSNKTHKRKVGVANQSYFQPAPRHTLPLRRIVIEQRAPPAILTDKILTSEEAVELFQIFFDKCNPHCCILERDFHTPTIVGSRSPFLFTVICAVASRYYEKRQKLYLDCLQAAKRIAFDVMVKGYKSVEVVQAFLLLTLWNQPAERFEEDRTWAFSGIAIRMAVDLNLHRKSTAQLPFADSQTQKPIPDESSIQQEHYEKEILNRERTWLYCFILDRSLSAQMGKPYTIREDFIIRSSKSWHKHRSSVPDDSGITAMVDLHRIHSRSLDLLYSHTGTPSGLNANLDYSLLMKTFSQSLDQWMTECTIRTLDNVLDRPGGYRHSMKEFYYNYYRLFTMSFMLQHTLENPDKQIELPHVYLTCYDAATRVIIIARDHLGPLGALRYAPDSQFVYIAYAAVFLLKLIRPQFSSTCDPLAVTSLVHDCTVLLEEVSVDEKHTPALYAAFLKVLLNSKKGSSPSPKDTDHSQPSTSTPLDPGGYKDPSTDSPSSKTIDRGTDGVLQSDQPTVATQREDVPLNTVPDRVDQITGVPFPTGNQLDPSFAPPSELPSGVNCPMLPFDLQTFEGFVPENDQPQSTNDCFVDSLLEDGGFWDSMLMPGYSGPLDALSGGVGLVSQFNSHDQIGFGFTPTGSGRATPNHLLNHIQHHGNGNGNGIGNHHGPGNGNDHV